jgi:hypothetical protein
VTREQQESTRELEAAKQKWLRSHGWRPAHNGRWTHHAVPKHLSHGFGPTYSLRDALTLTEAEPLVFQQPR